MEIKLPYPKVITVVKAQTVTTDTILINQVTDNGTSVECIYTPLLPERGPTPPHQTVILWDETAYETIGQWTDTDVKNRLLELL